MDWQLDKGWESFKTKWLKKSGIDLNLYKPAQMHRRINNFISRTGSTNYDNFLMLLDGDKELYHKFVEHLTINVTEFFRTPEKFEELEKIIIPQLLKTKDKLRIWSAGCSIGAEPYSIAMTLDELTPGKKHYILATDLDMEILAKAKAGGSYSSIEMKNISEGRLKKYFRKIGEEYVVNDEIIKKVDFKHGNLLKDKFETNFDLILCRNVVIYFTEEAKDKLYRDFFASLAAGGIIFVGGTEAIMNFRDMGYTQIRPFFYQKQ